MESKVAAKFVSECTIKHKPLEFYLDFEKCEGRECSAINYWELLNCYPNIFPKLIQIRWKFLVDHHPAYMACEITPEISFKINGDKYSMKFWLCVDDEENEDDFEIKVFMDGHGNELTAFLGHIFTQYPDVEITDGDDMRFTYAELSNTSPSSNEILVSTVGQ